MLMVGDSVALADAQPEVTQVAELAGLPIFECYASDFNVSATHPLYLGNINFVTPGPVTAVLDGCDCLLVVGAPLFQLIFPDPDRSPLPASAELIQIDINPWELGKNINPAISLLADPKAALAELAEQLRRLRTPGQAQAAADRAPPSPSRHARRARSTRRGRARAGTRCRSARPGSCTRSGMRCRPTRCSCPRRSPTRRT